MLVTDFEALNTAAVSSYIKHISSIQAIGNNNQTRKYDEAFLDLRAFKTCKWDTGNGCEGGIH